MVIDYISKVNFQKAGLKGFMNLGLNYMESKTHPIICRSNPATVMSEPTGNCNLKCKMCVRSAINYEKQGDIDFEKWVKIMDEEFPFWHFHGFIGIGEPLLHKDFAKMIEYLDKRGLWKFVTTNGILLTDSMIDSLVTHNLNRMFISVDGATKETYEKIRDCAKFDTIVSNIEHLVNEVKKRNSKMEIIMQSVFLKENAQEVPEMVKLAHKLGVNEYRFQDIELKFDTGWSTAEHSLRANREFFEKPIKEALKVGKELGVAVKLYNTSPPSLTRKCCIAPWNQVYIRWDGKITPCCTTLIDKTFFYGNIFEEHFKDMWNNEKAMTFRKMARSKTQPQQCVNCSCL
jgi:radical SAM protein with 4Fe4S-binding SPASM domain